MNIKSMCLEVKYNEGKIMSKSIKGQEAPLSTSLLHNVTIHIIASLYHIDVYTCVIQSQIYYLIAEN